jgi:LysR family hydrogen peroxide-inducible transcriptional activator
MPSLRQIEYLVALYEARHFRRAAEQVGVSQPTLSAQLKALEERLGGQLVERSRSRVVFTALGERIIENARRILRDVREMRETALSYGQEFGGTIRLGLPPTIGPYLLPRMLPQLHNDYPSLRLYVREQVPQTLPQSLQDGRYDVLVTPLPVRGADLESLPVFREPLYIAIPADHPLAAKSEIERADLNGQSILALEAGYQLHEQAEAMCEEFGARLLFDFEGTSLDTLRQMVGMGMGFSFLPGLYVKSVLAMDQSVEARQIKGRAISRTIGLVWRQTSGLDAQYRKLAGFVGETIARDFPDFVCI